MMLQLNPTIAVKTPKGDAEALIIIDYGVNVNSVWLCRMRGGGVLHFYSDDIRVYDNPMNGNGWDVGEEIKSAPKDENLPSGEDDIVLDFSKPPENKKVCICKRCKKEGEQWDILKGEFQFFPIISKPTTYGDSDLKGLEYVTAGYWLGHLCKDCFFARLDKKEEPSKKYMRVKCDMCGCTPSVGYRTNNKTLCRNCYNIPEF